MIFLALNNFHFENGPDFGDLGDFCPFGVFGECRCSGLDPDEVPDDGLEIEPDDGLDDELELEDGLEGLDPLLELLELLELELLDESELDDDEDDEDDDEDEDEDEDEDDEAENNPKTYYNLIPSKKTHLVLVVGSLQLVILSLHELQPVHQSYFACRRSMEMPFSVFNKIF